MLTHSAKRRVSFFCSALLTVSACTTVPYEAVNPGWVEPRSTLQVLYIPAPELVYVEVASGTKRYADYEISVGANLAASIMGASAGFWAGASYVAAGSGASPLLFINPYAAAASIVVTPVIGSALEARRQAVARNKAKPFQALLAQDPVSAGFAPVLEQHLATNQSLGFDSHDLTVLGGAESASKKNIQRQQGVHDGKILLVGSTANFSPKF